MLPKRNRNTRSEFNVVFKDGKKTFSPSFQFITLPQEQQKFSVVVSKKLIKGAFQRNKQKRRVFNILKNNQQGLPVGATLIIIKKDISQIDKKELEKQILETLKNNH